MPEGIRAGIFDRSGQRGVDIGSILALAGRAAPFHAVSAAAVEGRWSDVSCVGSVEGRLPRRLRRRPGDERRRQPRAEP